MRLDLDQFPSALLELTPNTIQIRTKERFPALCLHAPSHAANQYILHKLHIILPVVPHKAVAEVSRRGKP